MLISCVAYQNGEKLADIEPNDIHLYLVKPDCFVWVAVREPDARTLELMQAEFDLHPLAVEDARHGHQRPKYCRDISDHLLRLNQAIESMRDTVATAISVNLSMLTLQESETMKRLAAYGALIAGPTLIVGIYGMNFDHMPELHWRYGYWLVLAILAAVDASLFWRFRQARWV